MNTTTTRIIRWIARIWAILMFAFMLFMFIAHIVEDGVDPVLNFSARDSLMMISMVISVIGLALAWKWELLGGIMILGGMAAFYLFDFAFSGSSPPGSGLFDHCSSRSIIFAYKPGKRTNVRVR